MFNLEFPARRTNHFNCKGWSNNSDRFHNFVPVRKRVHIICANEDGGSAAPSWQGYKFSSRVSPLGNEYLLFFLKRHSFPNKQSAAK